MLVVADFAKLIGNGSWRLVLPGEDFMVREGMGKLPVSRSVTHSSCRYSLMALFLGLLVAGITRNAPGAELPPRLRRPVALAFTSDHQHLVVANRRGQSLSLVDLAKQKTIREVACGATLSDLKPLDDGNWMLATDESGHQLLLLRIQADQIHVHQRIAVSPYPVRVTIEHVRPSPFVTPT
ncbi:MAG: hypothetical protein OSB47_01000, partial [Pirellulaceae bacterium]|nr:hypothetical protein [Pirellulaceae bacterium]